MPRRFFIFVFISLVLLLSTPALSSKIASSSSTSSSSTCTCCCPKIFPRPELHSLQDQQLGEECPNNFSSSFFTGQRQTVLPSEGLVTVVAEPGFASLGPSSVDTPDPSRRPAASGSNSFPFFLNDKELLEQFMKRTFDSNNCSWTTPLIDEAASASPSSPTSATPLSTTTMTTGAASPNLSFAPDTRRCSLATCMQQWMENDVAWSGTSRAGFVPDLLSADFSQGISPIVASNLELSLESFHSRMSQSTRVAIGAVFYAPSIVVLADQDNDDPLIASSSPVVKWSAATPAGDDPASRLDEIRREQRRLDDLVTLQNLQDTLMSSQLAAKFCREAVAGLKCYQDKYWFLPNSGSAWVSDIVVPIGGTALDVVAETLPECDFILEKLQRVPSTTVSPTTTTTTTTTNRDTATATSHYNMDWLTEGYSSSVSLNTTAAASLLGYKPRVAFSRPGRILCHHSNSEQIRSTRNRRRVVVPVVPIVQSKSNVIFYGSSRISTCIRSHLQQQQQQQQQPLPGQQCSVVYAQETTCGDFFVGISTEYSLLLRGVTWVGLAVALVSSIALLLGASAITIAIDAQLLAVISQGTCSSVTAKPATKFLQQFLFLGRAVEEENNTASHYAGIVVWLIGVVAVTMFAHGLLVVGVSFVRRSLLKRRRPAASGGGGAGADSAPVARRAQQAVISILDQLLGKLYQLAASSAKEKQRKADKKQQQSSQFFLEERRVLARTAAALRFPSASLLVLLVALQGLWLSAVSVWWYSTTPVDSMPGIVGCLFALLLTLIILVLARQTRLVFTPYTWLHPEQLETDAREQAIEVSLAVHLRSLVAFKRSFFYPYGSWGPARPRQRMGTLFLPVKARGWIGVPFLVSLVTCLAVSVHPLTALGCCAQQMFLSLFFFGVALVVWKSQPMRAPYANSMFVAVRGSLAILTFCRTVFLVTDDQFFDAAYFVIAVLVQVLILVVGVVDTWCGLAEHFIWLPHLEYRQEVIRARTGGALRLQRQHEDGELFAAATSASSPGSTNLAEIFRQHDLRKKPFGFGDGDDDTDTDDDLMFFPGQHHVVQQQKLRTRHAALAAAIGKQRSTNHNNSNNSNGSSFSSSASPVASGRTATMASLGDKNSDDDDDEALLDYEMEKI